MVQKSKKLGGTGIDDCWSSALSGTLHGLSVYCPMVQNFCKKEACLFYSAEYDSGKPVEYDDGGYIVLDGVETPDIDNPESTKRYFDALDEALENGMITAHCLALEILEGLHWLVGRWDDNTENDNGLKSLVADMASGELNVNTFEQNTTRYCVTE